MSNEWTEKEATFERLYQQNRTATNLWRYIPEKVLSGVVDAYTDSDGYWIYLDYDNGWSAYDHDSDCGIIHEYTIPDLRSAIKTIEKAPAAETKKSKLKEQRDLAGLSQSGLAESSGVSVRMIQHYEQGFKDINKAAVITVKRLADALGCKIEDIIEE